MSQKSQFGNKRQTQDALRGFLAELKPLIEKAYEDWENAQCGDLQCGCVTSWIEKSVRGRLEAALDQWEAELDKINAQQSGSLNIEKHVSCQECSILLGAGTSEQPSSEISDGYHTFNELYEHRHALFAAVCNRYGSWKSKLHEDGTMFEGGWFIAGVITPKGWATYHVPISWWDKFNCLEYDRAPAWDGHTPKDVIERLISLVDER